jgi:radical SAM protein with 4Fe4S-binding SPASM domain
MSVQINMSIARHNAHQLPAVLELARHLGADALHTFLLVPVGCGVDIAEEQMVPPDEYEKILNWFYDRAQEGDIELKATCAPHYFRVVRQRRAAERGATSRAVASSGSNGHEIGPTEMTMPGSTGIALRSPLAPLLGKEGRPEVRIASRFSASGHRTPEIGGGVVEARPAAAAHPDSLQAMTKGCLAGTGVAFISYQGEVYPCGYLPVLAGNLHSQSLAEIWETAPVFQQLRDSSNLKGKCGYCEFRNICMGCRARAFAATGDFMDEEPCCVYQPRRVDAVVGPNGVRPPGERRSPLQSEADGSEEENSHASVH